ncbi:MAG: hypothetical protein Greene07147_244 [Parcubacteria group bacterium Greene0714_7]|nr:MAG: hypothetical protein Greene07147_244 [Parcubacteria group bacterium Greene0714_7]
MALLNQAESLRAPQKHTGGGNWLEAYLNMLFKVSGPMMDFLLLTTPKKN